MTTVADASARRQRLTAAPDGILMAVHDFITAFNFSSTSRRCVCRYVTYDRWLQKYLCHWMDWPAGRPAGRPPLAGFVHAPLYPLIYLLASVTTSRRHLNSSIRRVSTTSPASPMMTANDYHQLSNLRYQLGVPAINRLRSRRKGVSLLAECHCRRAVVVSRLRFCRHRENPHL